MNGDCGTVLGIYDTRGQQVNTFFAGCGGGQVGCGGGQVGCGGGQVVSVLAFYSDNPSSNPAEVYNFSVKLLLKRTKLNKKEAGVGPFL